MFLPVCVDALHVLYFLNDQKFKDVKSGGQDGPSTTPLRPIAVVGKMSLRKRRTKCLFLEYH